MTCEELDAMIATLNIELGNLNQQISDKESAIVAATPGCLSLDIWGGGIPSAPLSLASVTSRIGYLQGLFPFILPAQYAALMNTIAAYYAIKQMMDDKANLKIQADTVRAQVNWCIQQKQSQGCP